jgi:hypothetical protein
MSLLRLAFWLGLLVLLLPTDAQQQARFTSFAQNAMDRLTGFCDRNGRTCSAGSEVWATFLRKAEFGVRLVGDLLGAGGRRGPVSGSAAPPVPPAPPPGAPHDRRPRYPQGSLQPPADLYQPSWRAPGRSGGG